jgi:4-amino-4-deoxy-L-arabinose transferase-like glycosyltransferase
MIFFLIGMLYAATIFRMSVPLTGDQKVYLSIALEMKERGSFLIPYLFDHANFLKPPFQYWMTLLGWQIFGFNLFGALIPSVLAVVGSALLVKRLSVEKSSLSAIVFSSTLATMTYGTTAQMEIWIVVFYLGAWALYLDRKLFLTFLTVGIMAWIKGPLYPALFVFSIVLKEASAKNLRALLTPKFLFSLVLGVGVGLLWYFAAARTHYQELRDVFLGRENFGKIQTAQGSILGLWSEFLGTLFPVSLLVVASLFDANFRERVQKQKQFWLAYALIPAIFFTFFPYRVNAYLYLLTPVVAWLVLDHPNPKPWVRKILFGLSFVIALASFVFLFRLASGQWIEVWLAFAIAFTFAFWSFAHYRLQGRAIAIASLVLVCLVRFGATDIGEWDLRPLRVAKANSAGTVTGFAYLITPSEEDIWHEFGLISTAINQPIARVRDLVEAKNFIEQGGTVIFSDEQTVLNGVSCDPWRRLKRRIKFPLRELILNGLSIEDPELHRTFQLCRKSAR